VKGQLLVFGHAGRISIGMDCFIGEGTRVWSGVGVTIGDRVLVSHGVEIHDSTAHSMDPEDRHRHFTGLIASGHPSDSPPGIRSKEVIIEDDAWISFNCIILKGVRIGRGAIVAAGSVVTRDIPEGCIYRNEVRPIISPIRPRGG